jgi:exosortase family protein
MNGKIFLAILIYIYLLTVFRRNRLTSFYFIVGSIGLFFILIELSNPYWVFLLTSMVVKGVGILWGWTDWLTAIPKYNALHVFNWFSSMNISIDYECSGIIESCAYIALVIFFPSYSKKERLFYSILGIIWIFCTNIIRLSIVILVVHYGGVNTFYLSHSILGRLVFYILVLALYYNVFTLSQVTKSIYSMLSEKIKNLEKK